MGVVSTWIIAALRNRQFFSLAELNEAVDEKLYEFNHKPFQKKEGSRAVAFEEEKPFLLPLPAVPFEPAMWKVATVQYNYHISVCSLFFQVLQRNGIIRKNRADRLATLQFRAVAAGRHTFFQGALANTAKAFTIHRFYPIRAAALTVDMLRQNGCIV